MHIYAYGSLCRGEVSRGSDVDLLALVTEQEHRFDPLVFSVYTYSRIGTLWKEGNPFAWHLTSESRLIFAEDRQDFIQSLGKPSIYRQCVSDCEKFMRIFEDSAEAITLGNHAIIFELSTAFLAIRNIATCYSLGLGNPTFSRDSALKLGEDSLRLNEGVYSIYQSSRILSIRGHGEKPSKAMVQTAVSSLDTIHAWMKNLVRKASIL
jgi:hypothetical protein